MATPGGTTLVVGGPGVSTVDGLMWAIYSLCAVPPALQRLSFGGKFLQCGQDTADYGIQHASTVHLLAPGMGGGRTSVSPVKNPHSLTTQRCV